MNKTCIRKLIRDERGVTLIEILASIVLLTILITMMFNVFIQSATVNKTSEKIVDATYVAQTYMEKVFAISTYTEYSNRKNAIKSGLGIENENITENGNAIHFSLRDGEKDVLIKVDEDLNLYKDGRQIANIENSTRVVIKVYNIAGDLEVSLDNIIEWKED